MTRPPVFATLIVLAAIATMLGLGVWQLQRKQEKDALVAGYAAARDLPPVRLPDVATVGPEILYRRAVGQCAQVVERRSEAGRDRSGRSGWVELLGCNGSKARPGFHVVLGWTDRPAMEGTERPAPGLVEGVVTGGRDRIPRLVLETPVPGLAPARAPSPQDVPNNHLFYAAQWFFFALAAGVIYVLALRRRKG